MGARNERHLCAVNYNVRPGVEIVQGLLDIIMIAMKIPYNEEGRGEGYYLQGEDRTFFAFFLEYLFTFLFASFFCIKIFNVIFTCYTDSTFFPGWCGTVMVNDTPIGRLGLIHPEVITNFSLTCPAAALLLNIQGLLEFSKL